MTANKPLIYFNSNPLASGHDQLMPGVACHEFFPLNSIVLDQSGKQLSLKKLLGRRIVIEVGNLSNSNYIGNIVAMNRLQRHFKDVEFLVLFSSQTHKWKGNEFSVNFNRSKEQAFAAWIPRGENRKVIVDGPNDKLLNKIGNFPNSIYLLDQTGAVEFKRLWNRPAQLETYLQGTGRSSRNTEIINYNEANSVSNSDSSSN